MTQGLDKISFRDSELDYPGSKREIGDWLAYSYIARLLTVQCFLVRMGWARDWDDNNPWN